jgi:lipid A disaccharide synthetase
VTYVGHPLISRIQEHIYRPLDDLEDKKVIAFFPVQQDKRDLKGTLACTCS